jgi:hypothetical protein
MGHFEGYFEGAKTRDNLEGQKSLGPLKISLEMSHKVICPQKKNLPHFQNQRYINSYMKFANLVEGFAKSPRIFERKTKNINIDKANNRILMGS